MSWPWIVAFCGLWLVVLAVALVVLGFLRRVTNVLEQAEAALAGAEHVHHGVPPGTTLPEFAVRNASGQKVSSRELFAEPAIVVFMAPGCAPCAQLAERLEPAGTTIDGVPLFVIVPDTDDGHALLPGSSLIVLYEDGSASRAFSNRATPQGYAVSRGGLVHELAGPNTRAEYQRVAASVRNGGDATDGSKTVALSNA